jgi:hypothetical protein
MLAGIAIVAFVGFAAAVDRRGASQPAATGLPDTVAHLWPRAGVCRSRSRSGVRDQAWPRRRVVERVRSGLWTAAWSNPAAWMNWSTSVTC